MNCAEACTAKDSLSGDRFRGKNKKHTIRHCRSLPVAEHESVAVPFRASQTSSSEPALLFFFYITRREKAINLNFRSKALWSEMPAAVRWRLQAERRQDACELVSPSLLFFFKKSKDPLCKSIIKFLKLLVPSQLITAFVGAARAAEKSSSRDLALSSEAEPLALSCPRGSRPFGPCLAG